MDDLIKIYASVVSHVGMTKALNENNFYINGRSMQSYETDSVQVSVETSGQEHLFAVSDCMDRESMEKGTSISIMRELKRFQERAKTSSKGIEIKFDQLYETVGETRNLVYSMALGNDLEKEKTPSFGSVYIADSKIAVLNMGNTRVYMARGGSVRHFPSEHKKAERLLKMGIITNEQAEMLSSRYGITMEQNRSEIKKSEIWDLKEGDLFLICSRGLYEMVDEDRIYELLSDASDPGHVANMLVKEALTHGGKENVTVLVIRVGSSATGERNIGAYTYKRSNRNHYSRYQDSEETEAGDMPKTVRRVIAITVALVLICGAVYGLYRLWRSVGIEGEVGNTVSQTNSTVQTGEMDEEDQANQTEETSLPEENENTNETGSGTTPDNSGSFQETTYTVKAGDNLYKISKKFYNDPSKYKLIMEANGIENPDLIKIGQVLIIPDPTAGRP